MTTWRVCPLGNVRKLDRVNWLSVLISYLTPPCSLRFVACTNFALMYLQDPVHSLSAILLITGYNDAADDGDIVPF